MVNALSKALLDQFVEAYVRLSKDLAEKHNRSGTSFKRKRIASLAFRGTSAESALSRCCSEKFAAPLASKHLESVLEACRKALTKQFDDLGYTSPLDCAAKCEEDICRRLRIAFPARYTSFNLALRYAHVESSADLGFPDIDEWRSGTLPFAGNMVQAQRDSMVLLRELVPAIARENTDQRRLTLLRIAATLVNLHHPGSPWHSEAVDLGASAAGAADLLRLQRSSRVPGDIQRKAMECSLILTEARILTTQESPLNFTHRLMRGEPLDPALYRAVEFDVETSILTSRWILENDPANSWAARGYSSDLSAKARLLLATGKSEYRKQAREAHRASLKMLDRINFPYGLQYPILEDIAANDLRSALKRSEHAVASLLKAKVDASAEAFAALAVHLLYRIDASAQPEPGLLRLARKAVESPTSRYVFSHVFDVEAVEAIVKQKAQPQ